MDSIWLLAPIVVVLSTPLGCTARREAYAMHYERQLVAAGFQMKPASTEEAAKQLAGLPQRKLIQIPFEGERRWVYADAEFCHCLYMGSEAAHVRYQELLMQEIAKEAAAEMDWKMWGDGESLE